MRATPALAACVILLTGLCAAYLKCGLADTSPEVESVIISELRLPRMLCAMGVGALLSISGALMQGLFRNPLVEPYTMGISGGAIAGVAIAFTFGLVGIWGGWAVVASAAVGGLATMVAILALRRTVGYDISAMLMCGVMVSFVSSAATTVLLSLATREDASQVLAWSVGTFDGAGHGMALAAACAGAAATLLSPLCGNVLNILQLGEREAHSLGVDTHAATGIIFIAATLLAALSVSAAGVIPFVGMAVPHAVRSALGSDNRVTLPACGLAGATLTLACDLVAKTIISPRELPTGAICAVFGGAAFVYLTIKWKKTAR